MREVLPCTQRDLLARNRGEAPPVIHELHVEVDRHLPGLAVARPIHVVAGSVGPQWAPHRGVRFRHDAVGIFLDVIEVAGLRPLLADEVADGGGRLARRGQHELAIVVVRRFRDVLVVELPVLPFAGIAVAKPDLPAAIVARLIAEHVEEQAIDGVLVERFGQDLHRLVAIVVSVDAGGVEAVIDHRLSAGLPEEPLRMGVEDRLPGLTEIESSHHADLARVGFPQNVAEHVPPRGQVSAWVVKLNLRRVIGRDAAHPHQHHVGAHIRELARQARGIQARIRLPQVGLDPADGLLHPPTLLRRRAVHHQHQDR
jgi:hypothetical protein